MAIVLRRASSREQIPEAISELREEFCAARRELWDLFDEADFRIYDTKISARILREIEREAANIVPRALGTDGASPAIRFDLIGRALELKFLGVIKDLAELVLKEGWKRWCRLDASFLLESELKSVELRGLLEATVSESEYLALLRSTVEPNMNRRGI